MYEEIIPYLLHWYDYNKRILPWREAPTPYHVWVSEIMLQQTRVEAVKGYYDRFLTCLPDIKALAEAEEETLLKLWEGLGYYNRVRNMQKAAKVLVEQYDGKMPADYEKIRALPGIGDYTAGAISSIAFGLPYPAVDGNVLRVMSRITCSEEDIAKESTKKKLKEDLINVLQGQDGRNRGGEQAELRTKEITGDGPGNPYGDFNQSLMELGATVCLPNGKPLCEQCPVMHLCKAFHAGREQELPIKSAAKARRIEHRKVYLITRDGKVLLHRREKKGLLAGLWEFPNELVVESEKRYGDNTADGIAGFLEPLSGVRLHQTGKTKPAKHIFSHVEWHMEGIWLEVQTVPETGLATLTSTTSGTEAKDNATGQKIPQDWAFATPQELQEKYPIPSAFEAFVREILADAED
ncbi:MAG: A/G-specific adenine glycosylase [Lachnospiraceae bacterium]|nr:A/G-specific adenine glycosylase [Lachnospiraceae bacterium]